MHYNNILDQSNKYTTITYLPMKMIMEVKTEMINKNLSCNPNICGSIMHSAACYIYINLLE